MNRNKIGFDHNIGKLNDIVNCRGPMANVHFRVPYGLMSPHRYFGVPEFKGREHTGGDLREIALQDRV